MALHQYWYRSHKSVILCRLSFTSALRLYDPHHENQVFRAFPGNMIRDIDNRNKRNSEASLTWKRKFSSLRMQRAMSRQRHKTWRNVYIYIYINQDFVSYRNKTTYIRRRKKLHQILHTLRAFRNCDILSRKVKIFTKLSRSIYIYIYIYVNVRVFASVAVYNGLCSVTSFGATLCLSHCAEPCVTRACVHVFMWTRECERYTAWTMLRERICVTAMDNWAFFPFVLSGKHFLGGSEKSIISILNA